VLSEVNWRAPARLARRDGLIIRTTVELGAGDLAEMVRLATRCPQDEREQLVIICDGRTSHLAWPQIAKLAARVDFPLFI
jgi:hypothetical protein